MFTVTVDDREVKKALDHLAKASGSLRPVMKRIGERLSRSADDNFRAETDPEGKPWRLLHASTIEASYKSGRKNKRTQKKRGSGQLKAYKDYTGKRKILQDSGQLRGSISYSVDHDSVTIGSVKPYAAIHQLGGKAGRNKATTIPARPFLGVGPADREEILQLISDHLRIK